MSDILTLCWPFWLAAGMMLVTAAFGAAKI